MSLWLWLLIFIILVSVLVFFFFYDFGMGMAGLDGMSRQGTALLPGEPVKCSSVNTLIWLLIGVGDFTGMIGMVFVLPILISNLGPVSTG